MGKQASENDRRGMEWWNSATPQQRRYWLEQAQSARPVDAWRAYSEKRSAAYGH